MKKWAIIVVGVLVLVAALGAVTAEVDQELSDEEMRELIADIEAKCAETDCNPEGGLITDEQIEALGFDSRLIGDAWGICDLVAGGGDVQTCVCTEPEPPKPPIAPLPDQTSIYVGKQGGMMYAYDTLACKGIYYSESGWTYSIVGGCNKDYYDVEHLEVLGNENSDIDEDNIILVNDALSVGSCNFADWWWSSGDWDSVTADGQGGKDDVYGSPQDDDLTGEKVHGYDGDDTIHLTNTGITHPIAYGGNDDDTITGSPADDYLYGQSGYDSLIGAAGTGDYCNCGADSDPPADPTCEHDPYCDD